MARSFVLRSLEEEFERVSSQAFPADAKSRLQELSQSRFQSMPHYRLVRAEGPDHARRFTVEVLIAGEALGRGHGTSKQQAEKEAAQRALEHLEQETRASEGV